nr:hypothetical protein [uncultured Pseudodesulfovibrio sp.]
MATYIISYDLDAPHRDYSGVAKIIESCGKAWHCLDSTWLVVSTLDHAEIRNKVKAVLDSGDKLLVAKLSGARAWSGFTGPCHDWLKDNGNF